MDKVQAKNIGMMDAFAKARDAKQAIAKDIAAVLDGLGGERPVSDDYWPAIARAIQDDVVKDVMECADEGAWNNDDVSLAVGRVLCDRLGIDRNGGDTDETYDVVNICASAEGITVGIKGLFADCRVDRAKLPAGVHCYDLRGSDDDPGAPCTIEEHVRVNHAGCVITAEPVIPQGVEYMKLDEGLDFTDESMTVKQFVATYGKPKGKVVHALLVYPCDEDETYLHVFDCKESVKPFIEEGIRKDYKEMHDEDEYDEKELEAIVEDMRQSMDASGSWRHDGDVYVYEEREFEDEEGKPYGVQQ